MTCTQFYKGVFTFENGDIWKGLFTDWRYLQFGIFLDRNVMLFAFEGEISCKKERKKEKEKESVKKGKWNCEKRGDEFRILERVF